MRLPGFDYTKPFFYMVTLKRLPELAAFSVLSLLDGQCQIGPRVKKARKLGMPALAVTDRGNLFALKMFYDECRMAA